MAINPYAKFLGDGSAREVIDETAGRLKFLIERLG